MWGNPKRPEQSEPADHYSRAEVEVILGQSIVGAIYLGSIDQKTRDTHASEFLSSGGIRGNLDTPLKDIPGIDSIASVDAVTTACTHLGLSHEDCPDNDNITLRNIVGALAAALEQKQRLSNEVSRPLQTQSYTPEAIVKSLASLAPHPTDSIGSATRLAGEHGLLGANEAEANSPAVLDPIRAAFGVMLNTKISLLDTAGELMNKIAVELQCQDRLNAPSKGHVSGVSSTQDSQRAAGM